MKAGRKTLMLQIALYSNNSYFLGEFAKMLSSELEEYSPSFFKLHRIAPMQTTLFTLEAPYDICIADITDDPEEGMDFVRSLRRSATTDVMVIAPGPQWAMAAYDADVIAYYLSPPDVKRLAKVILKRVSRDSAPPELQFSFRTSMGLKLIAAHSILYVEYSDHRLIVHTEDGMSFTTTSMRSPFGEACAALLEDGRFVRTHVSFLVNVQHIEEFHSNRVKLDNGTAIPVSRARYRDAKEQFLYFFSKHMDHNG